MPNADFFLKMVPLLDGGQDVGMVLSPQVSSGSGGGCAALLLKSMAGSSCQAAALIHWHPFPHRPALACPPQTFYNLNAGGDIFNHANVHFWDYSQPGYDALGLISCTGTNFLVRARAFQQVRQGCERWGAGGRRVQAWLPLCCCGWRRITRQRSHLPFPPSPLAQPPLQNTRRLGGSPSGP